MRILADTSVWSLALRRKTPIESAVTREMAELVREGRVVMVGPVRQELLSGIGSRDLFRTLREHLRAFPDLPLEALDYEEAASCCNTCRAAGIQGSHTDFLLCAVSRRRELPIFTTDGDFVRYAKHLGVKLHEPRA